MRQKVVWFILGVLVGSLFVVSAYPMNGSVQYSAPTIQRIPGENYTTYLLYPKNGLPISAQFLKETIPKLLEKSAPNAKLHAYAIPELPEGAVISGYGIKVTKDGRVNILVTATRNGAPILPDKIRSELLEWGKKAPEFKPDVIPKEKVGVPKGWEVKIVDSNGNVKVYSGESSPYWHNFGRVEMSLDYKPYGRLYGMFYVWGLWNDNDPKEERFMITPYGGSSNSVGVYRVTPGTAIDSYGRYFTNDFKIIHNWGIDPELNGRLGPMYPAGIIGGHDTLTLNFGPSPGVSYTIDVDGYKVYGDALNPKAVWDFDIPYNEDASHHTIAFNGYSEGAVDEGALHDGEWHTIFQVELWARFRDRSILGLLYHYDGSVSVNWLLKIG
ncbi:hypothetical protein [Thermococcus gorgonarius]|uniref:Uncharacterized protein n=1 Tax=Thermococcus gorgonarius TaxID=71997 RepID=A0A2Z2M5B9_THEGO|nr:hypothetical protein [Thermococcus gorgonarius]ASJ00303.1 hypothetical protein A3K92_01820 [Thermococcus gorgonarius]